MSPCPTADRLAGGCRSSLDPRELAEARQGVLAVAIPSRREREGHLSPWASSKGPELQHLGLSLSTTPAALLDSKDYFCCCCSLVTHRLEGQVRPEKWFCRNAFSLCHIWLGGGAGCAGISYRCRISLNLGS